MERSSHKSWIGTVILVGVVYFLIGRGSTLPHDNVGTWRLAAWVASAGVAAAHIGYERFQLDRSPLVTALHAALAVALGAFLLAIAATINAVMVVANPPYGRYLLALVLWPIFTAVPAFLVSLAIASVLARLPAKRVAK
ncbi:MAG TPA: hypothetical protein VNO50_01270 [Pyrinomonadaceae bacterium]|nr:hypothetical protein [Pyrinomonadaceae bacterium]